MPSYDYFCSANEQTVTVEHRMAESLETWGEVCDRLGREPGDTPRETPVERMMSLATPLGGEKGRAAGPAHKHTGPSCACGHGGCGLPPM